MMFVNGLFHNLAVYSHSQVLLQRRDDFPEVVYPGELSLFGGADKDGIRGELRDELPGLADMVLRSRGVYALPLPSKDNPRNCEKFLAQGDHWVNVIYSLHLGSLEDIDVGEGSGEIFSRADVFNLAMMSRYRDVLAHIFTGEKPKDLMYADNIDVFVLQARSEGIVVPPAVLEYQNSRRLEDVI